MFEVRYLEPQEQVKVFHSEEAAKAFVADLQEKAKVRRERIKSGESVMDCIALIKEQPELKEMPKGQVSDPNGPLNIVICNPEHFRQTIKFAWNNNLTAQFTKSFTDLMHLLASTKKDYPPEIYPDGYQTPSFGWRVCGMVGGFIFHRSDRTWSIHT